MIQVLIIEDSPTVQVILKAILESDPGIVVVAQAANGAEGLRQALILRPDLITMDIHMPVMDGYETTRRIMEQIPTPIIVVSASAESGEVQLTFRALEAGALAVLEQPQGPEGPNFEARSAVLIHTVKTMAGIKVVQRWARPDRPAVPQTAPLARATPPRKIDLVAIAASTGGPAALATILGALPADTPVPILVVQHMTLGFHHGLVTWLSNICPLPVRLATRGELLRPGEVLLAPGETHLGVDANHRAVLSNAPPIGHQRPSATFLFESVAEIYGSHALGVILTGMGDDGAVGLRELKRAGGWVLAQNEATCVVYGMPAVAVALGVVDAILPLADIAGVMKSAWRRERKA